MKLTKEQAIDLYNSGWWKDLSAHDIVMFQLFEEKMILCLPFRKFHKAIEEVLKRPVYIYEFRLNIEELRKEFFRDKPAPTFQEIINILPKEKRILIIKEE